uniref:Uncharacterized protein n=1 Tax=Triticum urartu TaxID=4572 RepID=A0A8R7TUB8_TRIUA
PRPPTPQLHRQDPLASFSRASRERAKCSGTRLLARSRSQSEAHEIVPIWPIQLKICSRLIAQFVVGSIFFAVGLVGRGGRGIRSSN